MDIVEYFDRFATCPKTGTGEPCPKCSIAREILAVIAKHVPDWASYNAAIQNQAMTSGAEEFGRLHVAAEAAVCAAMFACLMASSTADSKGDPRYPEPLIWTDAFAGVLARELARAGVARRVMVVPRIDVMICVDDPRATQH